MQDKHCKQISSHINRLEGQLKAIKKFIEHKQDCEKTLNLFSSFIESAKSLKSKILIANLQSQKVKLTTKQIKLINKTTKI